MTYACRYGRYMNFVMYVLGEAGMTNYEQRFANSFPGHVVQIPQAGFFFTGVLVHKSPFFRDFTIRALLKRWYCVSLMFWVKIDGKFSVSTKNAPISSKTARFSKKHVAKYKILCSTRFTVQNMHFDFS